MTLSYELLLYTISVKLCNGLNYFALNKLSVFYTRE